MTTLASASYPAASELLSALADGELAAGAADAELNSAFQSSTVLGDWNSYQVIGLVLRGGIAASAPLGADPVFVRRLTTRLADEKVAPPALAASSQVPVALTVKPAANEAIFRWKLVAGLASLSAAVVVAWSFVASPGALPGAQLAQNPGAEQVLVASPQGPMVRDARLEELMAAHKQLGGSSLQAPSGFLRNAGLENSQTSRR